MKKTLETLRGWPLLGLPPKAPLATREDSQSPPARPYLRRYAVQAPRPRYGKLLLGFLFVGSLLFAKVWESTVAHSLSMERDRLRNEVRGLANRIRLTRELKNESTLVGSVDPRSLEAKGFVAPDPARIVDIDLDAPVPRALPRTGIAGRLSSWLGRPRTPRTADQADGEEAALVHAEGP